MGKNANFGGSGKKDSTQQHYTNNLNKDWFKSGYNNNNKLDPKEVENYLIGDDKIQCLECGRWYKRLTIHLQRSHAMGKKEYCQKYGLPDTGLDCKTLSESKSIFWKNEWKNEEYKEKTIKGRETHYKSHKKEANKKIKVNCGDCGAEITRKKGVNVKKYICQNCQDCKKKKKMESYKLELVKVKCDVCGKQHQARKDILKRTLRLGRKKVCSQSCKQALIKQAKDKNKIKRRLQNDQQ